MTKRLVAQSTIKFGMGERDKSEITDRGDIFDPAGKPRDQVRRLIKIGALKVVDFPDEKSPQSEKKKKGKSSQKVKEEEEEEVEQEEAEVEEVELQDKDDD